MAARDHCAFVVAVFVWIAADRKHAAHCVLLSCGV